MFDIYYAWISILIFFFGYYYFLNRSMHKKYHEMLQSIVDSKIIKRINNLEFEVTKLHYDLEDLTKLTKGNIK